MLNNRVATVLLVLYGVVTVLGADVNHGYTCYGHDPSIISDNSTRTIKCSSTGANDTAAKNSAYCYGPNNSMPNNTFTEFGCGRCPDNAVDKCRDCAAWDSANGTDASDCNEYDKPIFSYSCYIGGVSVLCSNGSSLENIHCWGPQPTYKLNNLNLTECGCGTCQDALAANPDAGWNLTDCSTCNYNNCNGAARATMLGIVPACLAFFTLSFHFFHE